MKKLFGKQSIVITLDVNKFLYDRLEKIAQTEFSVVEINCVDGTILTKALHDFPMLNIGAGNIIDTQQLETCYQAGVSFITSPGFIPAIAQTATIYSINYFPGVATLSEAMQALASGCQRVRPYPANRNFCTLLNKCLPMLDLFPAEIAWEEIENYLDLPGVAGVSVLNPESQHLRTSNKVLEHDLIKN